MADVQIPREASASELHAARVAAAGLSMLQHDLLVYLARGMSNPSIAFRTHRSEDTIKTHLRRIYTTLGARGREHAVAIAYRRGLFLADPNSEEVSQYETVADLVAQAVKCLLYDEVHSELDEARAQLDDVRARLDDVLSAVRRIA